MVLDIITTACILFSSVVLHEYAHGWVAYRLGDSTAKDAGRLTLNPLKHIDPVGTLFLPGILLAMRAMGIGTVLFGWAKPVPVNFNRLRNPKRSMIWVGLAGPAINIIVAFICAKLLISDFVSLHVAELLLVAVFINLLLAIFNMVPIPPLDGSRLVMGLLPQKYLIPYARLERYGILIVVLLISATNFFENIILPIIEFSGNLLGVNFRGVLF
ncbi:FIG004556: membrane metalloprotease [hydrothermal vent metagenome]|uniref:FIG004556: membrane metalloprotease n=1 Tax=hydrothermal vent metagenome TaxID=652676 RepID=A0A3B1DP21_9ZZZZ